MKKLYYYQRTLDVVFYSEEISPIRIVNEGDAFLIKELETYANTERVGVFKELNCINDLPNGKWLDAIPWGSNDDDDDDDDDYCVRDLLLKTDKEYEEYLRLKAKFEKFEE